jgi:hypothetical protein
MILNTNIFKYGNSYDIINLKIDKIYVKLIDNNPNYFNVYRYKGNKLVDKYKITREYNASPYTITFKSKYINYNF